MEVMDDVAARPVDPSFLPAPIPDPSSPSRSIDQTPVPIPIPILSPVVDLPITDLPSIDSPRTFNLYIGEVSPSYSSMALALALLPNCVRGLR